MVGKKSGIQNSTLRYLGAEVTELLPNAKILKIMLKTLSGPNLKNLGKRAHFLERAL